MAIIYRILPNRLNACCCRAWWAWIAITSILMHVFSPNGTCITSMCSTISICRSSHLHNQMHVEQKTTTNVFFLQGQTRRFVERRFRPCCNLQNNWINQMLYARRQLQYGKVCPTTFHLIWKEKDFRWCDTLISWFLVFLFFIVLVSWIFYHHVKKRLKSEKFARLVCQSTRPQFMKRFVWPRTNISIWNCISKRKIHPYVMTDDCRLDVRWDHRF